MFKKPYCVAWRDASGVTQWCATFRNSRPSEDAVHDPTACGYTVTMRIDEDRRDPSCRKCRERVRVRRGSRERT